MPTPSFSRPWVEAHDGLSASSETNLQLYRLRLLELRATWQRPASKATWAQAAAPDQGPQAVPMARPRPVRVRWPAAQGAARQCSTQVLADTAYAKPLGTCPQINAEHKACKTLLWPRRSPAAGLGSADTRPKPGYDQRRLRARVQGLRTVPRSDLPQALRGSGSKDLHGRCRSQPLPCGQAASRRQAPSPQRIHSQSHE